MINFSNIIDGLIMLFNKIIIHESILDSAGLMKTNY